MNDRNRTTCPRCASLEQHISRLVRNLTLGIIINSFAIAVLAVAR